MISWSSYYFELPQGNPEIGVHRSDAVEAILRERHDVERQQAAETTAVLDDEG